MPTDTNPPDRNPLDAPTNPTSAYAGSTKVQATWHPNTAAAALNTPPVPPQLTGMAARMYATFYNHGQPTRAEIADCLRVTEEFQREALAAVAPQVRYPVAPKVWAGTWGAFGAGTALVVAVGLLDAVGVIPSVFPGSPVTAAVVALLTPTTTATASFIRSWMAAHQARPADSVVLSPGSEVGGQGGGLEQVQR